MSKKTGIMGGTFNPIHNGHLLLAEEAREFLNLDEVIFMPSGNSYMKSAASILKGEMRARMVELAISGNPYYLLSRMELERKGPTYTCDTLVQLKNSYPENEFYFIAGADTLLTLEGWKNPEMVLKNCIMAVAAGLCGRRAGTDQLYTSFGAYKPRNSDYGLRFPEKRSIL